MSNPKNNAKVNGAGWMRRGLFAAAAAAMALTGVATVASQAEEAPVEDAAFSLRINDKKISPGDDDNDGPPMMMMGGGWA